MINKTIKHAAAIITAFLLIAGMTGTGLSNNQSCMFQSGLSVSAAAVSAGVYTGTDIFEYVVPNDSDISLYFKLNTSNQTASLCGSKLKSGDKSVEIPNSINVKKNNTTVKYSVNAISASAFIKQTNLKTISVQPLSASRSGTVYPVFQSIGKDAFSGCSHLVYCDLRSEIIEESAFESCTSLSTVNLDDTVYIRKYAFINCRSLKSVNIYGKEIGQYAFSSCTGLTETDLSESKIVSVSDGAFCGCSNLKRIQFPETLKVISKKAFMNTAAEVMDIPDSVEGIGDEAFSGCKNLKTFLTPDTIKEIGAKAFFNCTSLKYFVCENSITVYKDKSIGYYQKSNGSIAKTDSFVIWIDSKSDSGYTYASQNGFTCKIKKTAVSTVKSNLDSTKYNFINSEYGTRIFTTSSGNHYVDPRHYPYSSSIQNEKWSGSCYGMSSLYILVRNGYITENAVTGSYRDSGKNTISLINTFHSQRVKGNKYIEPTYISDFHIKKKRSGDSWKAFNSSMIKYIEYIDYGADLSVLTYSCAGNKGDHAVVCFGLEYKSNASDSQSDVWKDSKGINANARILIYDVNNSGHQEKYDIYVNVNSGKWYMTDTLGGKSDYQNYENQIQLNFTTDRLFDTTYSLGLSSEEFISKAVGAIS